MNAPPIFEEIIEQRIQNDLIKFQNGNKVFNWKEI
jgi:hypothetical protein